MDNRWVPEKMCSLTGHRGNANQNHSKTAPHPCQNSYRQEDENQQALEGLSTAGGTVNGFGQYGKQEEGFSRNGQWDYRNVLAIPLLGIYLKETKTLCRRDICTPLFTAALLK